MPETVLTPGRRVQHPDFGVGVTIDITSDGYARVFFPSGERRVHQSSLKTPKTRVEEILDNVTPDAQRLRYIWLHIEAHALPLIENAAALTAAPIDLLPHQVVLTHRVATANPRRFLVADEVGLGKTIETALLLRELASRGELSRALMVVPAGLVNNWHHELNEVFHLNFEVFGSEGDVTDRRSNAFAKHDRLIASVDTLKRRARINRLKEAPQWDLVVFDEAHHLSAYKNGSKIRKTENYKLAEVLKDHTRDLILLSATPHQGDHFRFWMLIQLLNPTLFKNPENMVEERHRLNTVIFRRTKADACRPDGSLLFARRMVHTESFTMSDGETLFYSKLREYLRDGFNLAKQQGSKGRSLGFVMTIFQKIAASSFAAVHTTLVRRQLSLTIHEAILKDQDLDIDGHVSLLEEARELIHTIKGLPQDPVGRGEVERILADMKLQILKKLDEETLAAVASSDSSETMYAQGEDLAATTVSLSLPEERLRISELLSTFPEDRETKVEKLLRGLGALWKQNPKEKVVIFATYLATVDLLSREIETVYPGQGVVVLKGGDHGTKLAVERRFRRPDGPRVMVCTAAGREGINLQFSRVLFNFDLPWNPMDIEQRIGRIHRYGQRDTAQVYNLVLSDTIEGKIYLLLTDKLSEIASTLGKVDSEGNITEDFRSQILGQLTERLSYDELYRQALSDPELKQTQEELEAAITNATEARKVVFELFQDLEDFSLDDYKPLSDTEESKQRIISFLTNAVESAGGHIEQESDEVFRLVSNNEANPIKYTFNRELAQKDESLTLMGIDHPILSDAIQQWQSVKPSQLGTTVNSEDSTNGVLTVWRIQSFGGDSETRSFVFPIALDKTGQRLPIIERQYQRFFTNMTGRELLSSTERHKFYQECVEPGLHRELNHRGIASQERSYSTELLAWIEITT